MDNATVSLVPSAQALESLDDYLRLLGPALAERIVESFPPLHGVEDLVSPLLARLRREPYPAQALAVMGVVRRLEQSRSAAVVAECGTGKTLIALASIFVHSRGRHFTALVLTPPHLVEKWAREAFQTLPGVRVFMIDGLRSDRPHTLSGVNEVKLRNRRIVREGLKTTLTELRLRNGHRSARARWNAVCDSPAIFIVGRERAKLSHFWKHAYNVARCGRYAGSIVNPDSGCPVYLGADGERLIRSDFKDVKLAEWLGGEPDESEQMKGKRRRALYSALWQADRTKIHRFAPAEFIARYMPGFFDYSSRTKCTN